jgi:hypothetical protein
MAVIHRTTGPRRWPGRPPRLIGESEHGVLGHRFLYDAAHDRPARPARATLASWTPPPGRPRPVSP